MMNRSEAKSKTITNASGAPILARQKLGPRRLGIARLEQRRKASAKTFVDA